MINLTYDEFKKLRKKYTIEEIYIKVISDMRDKKIEEICQ